jgi:hypothetical protein
MLSATSPALLTILSRARRRHDSSTDALEIERRRSLANRAILVFLLVWGIDCLYDLALGGAAALPALVIGILALAIAYTLNRLDRVTVAGVVLVTAIFALYLVPTLVTGAQLDTIDLRLFFVPVEAVLVAAIVLPPASVFVVAALNIATILALTLGAPHTTAFTALAVSGQVARTIEQATGLNLLVASLAYSWVRSAERALARMDRAEAVATLQQRALVQKQAPEAEVTHLLDIHVRVANGDLGARAQMQQHHMLWMVGVALNNLLARYQGLRTADLRLQATERAVASLILALRQKGHASVNEWMAWPEPNGTAIGALLQELRSR